VSIFLHTSPFFVFDGFAFVRVTYIGMTFFCALYVGAVVLAKRFFLEDIPSSKPYLFGSY
jgi:hypothetical protein